MNRIRFVHGFTTTLTRHHHHHHHLIIQPHRQSSSTTILQSRIKTTTEEDPFSGRNINGYHSHRTNDNNNHRHDLPHIRRIYAISDLHTDNISNFSWLQHYCTTTSSETTNKLPGPNDALIIAGDISHELQTLQTTFELIQQTLQCEIFFVPGNHEAWIGHHPNNDPQCSFDKLRLVAELCRDRNVRIDHCLVGDAYTSPTWILPMQSWYDGSLALPNCQDLCHDIGSWPWVDFTRCVWPERYFGPEGSSPVPTEELTMQLLNQNRWGIREIRRSFQSKLTSKSKRRPGLITFSHFLPNCQTLPDWKDVSSQRFLREEWLDHGAPEISAKFAMVSGSSRLDSQIRSIVSPSQQQLSDNDHHVHIFGHSHRPKDVIYNGIRYIHNPLGKPSERELKLIDPKVGMKLIWDTTTKEGMVDDGERVIRYWEERGGGRMGLWLGMARRKKRRKEKLRMIMEGGRIT